MRVRETIPTSMRSTPLPVLIGPFLSTSIRYMAKLTG